MADLERHTASLRGVDELIRLARGRRQRLLDEDRDAALERREGERVVGRRG